LRGRHLWSYYCALRLSAVLALERTSRAPLARAEWQDEYFHYLATGEHWCFTSRRASPVSVGRPGACAPEALDRIGPAFERYVDQCGLIPAARRASRIVIAIDTDSQIPFALLLVRLMRDRAPSAETEIACGPGTDSTLLRASVADAYPHDPPVVALARRDGQIEPILTNGEVTRAVQFFRRSPDRLLAVGWRPWSGRAHGSKIRRCLAMLRSRGIPVALELAPRIGNDAQSEDAIFHGLLDHALDLQPFVRDITINVRPVPPARASLRDAEQVLARGEALSDLLYVQLVAELGDVRLVPWRARRKAVGPATRLRAAPAHVVRSPFDLAQVSAVLDPDKDGRSYRLGRGHPIIESPTFRRAASAGRYLLFIGCPQAIPVSRSDAGYTDALAFFATPRQARGFIDQFRGDTPARVVAFLDLLVHNDILRPA
jgi:hypothetical protein